MSNAGDVEIARGAPDDAVAIELRLQRERVDSRSVRGERVGPGQGKARCVRHARVRGMNLEAQRRFRRIAPAIPGDCAVVVRRRRSGLDDERGDGWLNDLEARTAREVAAE